MTGKNPLTKTAALIITFCLLFSQAVYADSVLVPIENPHTDTSAVLVTQTQNVDIEEPEISSQGACLIDAYTGQVLYGKNENEQFYPASITKVMTALLVLENCALDEVVTFSAAATTNLESGAVTLNLSEGDQLTVEEALYGLLLKSANDIGNGLAEHVSGSVSAFADLMNQRAVGLGCLNTHFTNPHGLTDSGHKTTPYDMCLIMAEALKNPTFQKIDTTLSYRFPAVKKAAACTISPGHKMLDPANTSYYYEGIIGGKTGYLSTAGNTLVTGAERDGVRLVACVMKSSGTHYTDTRALLDYGFENYEALTGQRISSTAVAESAPAAAGPAAVVSGPAAVQEEETTAVTSAPPVAGVQTEAPGSTAALKEGWSSDSDGTWYYVKPDGQTAASEWLSIDGLDYWFEADGAMAVGWKQFSDGSWYYLRPDIGYAMKNSWVEDRGLWYYLGSDGVMLVNTVTPDGYTVDENGVWRE